MLTWDEDERPPSGYTRMYVLGMRLMRAMPEGRSTRRELAELVSRRAT